MLVVEGALVMALEMSLSLWKMALTGVTVGMVQVMMTEVNSV